MRWTARTGWSILNSYTTTILLICGEFLESRLSFFDLFISYVFFFFDISYNSPRNRYPKDLKFSATLPGKWSQSRKRLTFYNLRNVRVKKPPRRDVAKEFTLSITCRDNGSPEQKISFMSFKVRSTEDLSPMTYGIITLSKCFGKYIHCFKSQRPMILPKTMASYI